MKKRLVLFFAAAVLCLPLFAEISFDSLDLNLNDELLFTVKTDMPGTNPYKSLFCVHLKNGNPEKEAQILTCYPEQMELLNDGKTLQIRNRYGTARYYSDKNQLKWINRVNGIPAASLPIAPYSASPDGKYFCRIEKESLCSGALILEDSATGKTVVLNDNIINSYESVPVKWAPEGNILVYEKGGNVYFCNPDAVLRGIEIEERYRKIGRGTINSVEWASQKYLAYIDDYILYRINSKELYTMGLYSGIIGQGTAMGRIPFQFNPSSDKFSANSGVTSLVIVQNTRLISYMKVQSTSCDYMDVIYSKPFTDNTASLADSFLYWNSNDVPVLWLEKLPYQGSGETASVYNLGSQTQQVFEIQDSGTPFISPDGKKVAFFAGSTIFIYDINSWMRLAELSGEKIVSALWVNNRILYVGGEKTIRKWDISENTYETVALSSAEAGYWDVTDYSVMAKNSSDGFYRYDGSSGIWKKTSATVSCEAKTQNGRYRCFTGKTQNKFFGNALYVRTLTKKPVTKAIFADSVKKNQNNRKIALVFDAYDNADGLPKILASLKKFNVKGSFFLNGEFIRRYPSETKQIVSNGHSCSSMFFTTTNLLDKTFVIDEDFISRGLARNEDEFYACTGKELSLNWHAPFYSSDINIQKYGETAGYKYFQSYHEVTDYNNTNLSPEQLIQKYYDTTALTKGGIVPVAVGFAQGNNAEPLYKYLDLLISAFIDAGYEFVEVDDLN